MNTAQRIKSPTFSPHLPLHNRLFRWSIRFACFALFKIKVENLDRIPRHGCILVANHLSWIDHLLLMAVLPPEPRPYLLGASQSLNSSFKTWLLDTFGGVILFPRGANWVGKDTFRKPRLVLESGASLLLFPEGNVGKEEGNLLPILRGIGHFCLQANCAIVPIALSGVRELYWRKEIRVIIGEPFRVKREGQGHHAAVDSATEQVQSTLRELLPPYVQPIVTFKPLHFLTNLSDHL